MTTLTLVSHHLCPYVQRAAIALAEKGVAFERVHVDLSNKPDWFVALSPLGKVPLLKVRDGNVENVIFESAVILEFLEETQPVPLHPADPLDRARHRSWIEFGSAMLNAIGRLYNAKTATAFDREAEAIGAMADRIERELAERGGSPWFDVGGFSLVDAVYAPVFRYFDVFEREAGAILLDRRDRLAIWRIALAQRESVRDAVDGGYAARLRDFLLARESAISARILAPTEAAV